MRRSKLNLETDVFVNLPGNISLIGEIVEYLSQKQTRFINIQDGSMTREIPVFSDFYKIKIEKIFT